MICPIDEATIAHRESNPPPPWWPIPPAPMRVWQFHPVVGPPAGGRLGEDRQTNTVEIAEADAAQDAARMPDRDILEHVYPGDTLTDVARRLGYSRNGLRYLRHRWPDLAAAMDRRRGAWGLL